MEREVRLSPEELYFMASLMKAQYIDYTYVAAMQDIEQRYALYKHETQAKLVKKGLLDENFSGDIDVLPTAQELLTPIFFGEFESSVDICYVQEEERRVEVNRFHFYEGSVIHVQNDGAELLIRRIDADKVHRFAEELLPHDYVGVTQELDCPPNTMDISRVLAVKCIEIGKKKSVDVFIEANGNMCFEKSDESFVQLSRDEFVGAVLSTIWRA